MSRHVQPEIARQRQLQASPEADGAARLARERRFRRDAAEAAWDEEHEAEIASEPADDAGENTDADPE